MTESTRNYEIKSGLNGSGVEVFFIEWVATETQRFEIEGLDFPFTSESEAVANAECQTRCGARVH